MIVVGRDKSGEALLCRLGALRRDSQHAKLNLVSEIKENYRMNVDTKLRGR